jgi:hypothetical protein
VFRRPFNRHARRAKAPAPPLPWPGSGLHVCCSCRSDLVYATERRREGAGRWRLTLCCGQCGGSRDVVIGDGLVQRFDADVARGLAAIASDITALDRERMTEQVEVFAAALQRDLIDAGDFRT